MPYTNKFNEKRFSLVESYLKKLQEAAEDKVIVIETSSSIEAERLRWLFYDYLHLIGATKVYFIKKLQQYILIGKKAPSLENLVPSTPKSFDAQYDSLLEKLIASRNPREYIKKLLENKELSLTAISLLLWEYSRIMGE